MAAQWSSDDDDADLGGWQQQQQRQCGARRKRARRLRRLRNCRCEPPVAPAAHHSLGASLPSTACCRLPAEEHARAALFGRPVLAGHTTMHCWSAAAADGGVDLDRALRLAASLPPAADPDGAAVEQIQGLLAQGADVNGRDMVSGRSALHGACSAGNQHVVRLLLACGAKADAHTHKLCSQNESPLHVAAAGGRWHCANLLLEAGAATRAFDYKEQTPLYVAAHAGRLQVVKLLLAYGADPNCRTCEGYTALTEAVGAGDAKLTELLLDAGAVCTPEDALLHTAVRHNNAPCVRTLLAHGHARDTCDGGLPPLHWAARLGYVATVRALLECGADVNKEANGWTPLHCAVRWIPTIGLGNVYDKRDARMTFTSVVAVLCTHGANVDVYSVPLQSTPLSLALRHRHYWTAAALLSFGSDASLREHGLSPSGWLAAELRADAAPGLLCLLERAGSAHIAGKACAHAAALVELSARATWCHAARLLRAWRMAMPTRVAAAAAENGQTVAGVVATFPLSEGVKRYVLDMFGL